MPNKVPKGLLEKYREGGRNRYLPLDTGFLRLEYSDGLLFLVSYVLRRRSDSRAIGPRLEMMLEGPPVVTFITEMGVSGLQWSHGEVFWGHTYEDDGPPAKGRRIALEDWVDECIEKMVNPTDIE